MKHFLLKYYSFLPVILLSFFYILMVQNFSIHDFANYYFGGKFIEMQNFNSDTYFPYLFNKAISELGYTSIFVSYAPNTPFLAVLFYPLAQLKIENAKLLFSVFSSILFIFSLIRLTEFYKINKIHIALLPFLFFVPIKNNILFGQVYFLLFFLLAETLIAYELKKWKKMAIFLSFAILLKIFPILFILPLFFKKQIKPVLYTGLICSFLLGVTLFFMDCSVWIFFFKEVLSKSSNGEIATSFVDNYQSVFMFLKRLLIFDAIENPNSFFNHSNLFFGLIFGFKIFILVIGYFISKKNQSNLIVFSFWIFASILISPYGSTYTFLLLIFPFFAFLKMAISMQKIVGLIFLLFFVNNIPLSQFSSFLFPFSYLRLVALVAVFILFLFLLNNNIKWKQVSFLYCVVTILFVFINQHKTSNTEHFLGENAPILLFDYMIENNNLIYFYWNEKGINKETKNIKVDNYNKLEIKNKKIYYKKKQLTIDKSNKLKPVLINNKNHFIFIGLQQRNRILYIT
jgi:hypothetical protein